LAQPEHAMTPISEPIRRKKNRLSKQPKKKKKKKRGKKGLKT
jgi:hypothetical protein